MRQVIDPVPVVIELLASGAGGITASPVDDIRLDSTNSSNSDTQNLRLRFPATFDPDSNVSGLYQARFWLQGALRQTNVSWTFLLKDQASLLSTDFDGSALVSPDAVPLVYVENENIDKTLYYNPTGPNAQTLGVLQLQLLVGATVPAYDTDESDRQDPQIIFEFERQDGGFLAFEEPNPNSDHLWQFSDCDIYVNSQTSMLDGTLIESRQRIGWCADEDFTFNAAKETVNFMKGKPSAMAVNFFSKISATLTCKIAELDPFVFAKTMGIVPTEENRKIIMKEIASQRSIPQMDVTFEWFTNAGHVVQLRMRKSQWYLDGELAPGGNEIARQGFKVMPLVNACNKNVFELSISKSPVQRASLCVAYGITS